MAEQLLDRAEVLPVLEHVGGERMAQAVACRGLEDPGSGEGVLEGAVDEGDRERQALAE